MNISRGHSNYVQLIGSLCKIKGVAGQPLDTNKMSYLLCTVKEVIMNISRGHSNYVQLIGSLCRRTALDTNKRSYLLCTAKEVIVVVYNSMGHCVTF